MNGIKWKKARKYWNEINQVRESKVSDLRTINYIMNALITFLY